MRNRNGDRSLAARGRGPDPDTHHFHRSAQNCVKMDAQFGRNRNKHQDRQCAEFMFEKLLSKIGLCLDKHSLPYMIIGGQAVLLYREPRLTRDIDITLEVVI
jgi:hypothetical protein